MFFVLVSKYVCAVSCYVLHHRFLAHCFYRPTPKPEICSNKKRLTHTSKYILCTLQRATCTTRQVHDGQHDIARADALRFAREGGPLRRTRILQSTSTVVIFRVFREYPKHKAASSTTTPVMTAPDAAQQSSASWLGNPHWSRTGEGVETTSEREVGGGQWVVEIGGRRQSLVGLRGDSSRKRGLVFVTKEDGEIEGSCDDEEAYRMWLGVAAAVCPGSLGSVE